MGKYNAAGRFDPGWLTQLRNAGICLETTIAELLDVEEVVVTRTGSVSVLAYDARRARWLSQREVNEVRRCINANTVEVRRVAQQRELEAETEALQRRREAEQDLSWDGWMQ